MLLCSVSSLLVLLGTVFLSHGTVEMSVSTGLSVVALSVEMVARKTKWTWVSRHIGKVQPEVQRSNQIIKSHIFLNYRQRTLKYITSLCRVRRCHLKLYLRQWSSCALHVAPVSGTIPRSRAAQPNINRTESRLLPPCSVTRAGIESRSVEAAPCRDGGGGGCRGGGSAGRCSWRWRPRRGGGGNCRRRVVIAIIAVVR